MTEQLLGLATGFLFGFFLQKGRVLRFEKQIGALLLKDMTIIKFMLSAVLVGMIGIYALKNFDLISLNHKSMNLGAIIVGGTLFGIGWPLAGYCPGTAVGAVGEGRWHALFAILGMLAGAAIYAESYPFLKSTVLAWKDFGNLSLPEVVGTSPWVIIILFWIFGLALFRFFEKRHL